MVRESPRESKKPKPFNLLSTSYLLSRVLQHDDIIKQESESGENGKNGKGI